MGNYSFELNNAHRDSVVVKDTAKFNKFVEICSALFTGMDADKFGAEKDKAVATLKGLGRRAAADDWAARAELNEIVKFIVQPKLLESMKLFSFMGNYHEIPYDAQAMVKTYNYEGMNARAQASGGDVPFAGKNWLQYPVTTHTISSGMVLDYREMESGNFNGTVAEEISQIQIDMNNKAIAFVLETIYNSLKNNTKYVKFFEEYSGTVTQTAVDGMIAKMRRMGKVNITGDFSVLSAICDWNGYKTVSDSTVPFYTEAQVDEMAKVGLNGFYKGAALVELPNPYNFTKPLADKTGFELYHNPDRLYFIAQGTNSPVNIFRRGGMTSMSGNDVETGVIKTRYDIEIGADVVKGREFEIGMLAKSAD